MYRLLRKFFFILDPEQSHDWALTLLSCSWFWRIVAFFKPKLVTQAFELWGLRFPNRLGLAAGLDKDGECLDAWFALGFGFVEVGTVTPKAQPGNPKPRLFRLVGASAIINRMGFNNRGVDHLVENLKRRHLPGIVGVNIGKNKDTPLENALDDYRICLTKVYPYADYVVINISSPNTPGLRELQNAEYLDGLLAGLKTEQVALEQQTQRRVPLLVKIAPDLSDDELYSLADSLMHHQIDGVIATNTTLDRSQVLAYKESEEAGGLSGKPLLEKSNEIVRKLHQHCGARLPIIGVGGVQSAEDARTKLAAGASLVQIYTGFIYQGPVLIDQILLQELRD